MEAEGLGGRDDKEEILMALSENWPWCHVPYDKMDEAFLACVPFILEALEDAAVREKKHGPMRRTFARQVDGMILKGMVRAAEEAG